MVEGYGADGGPGPWAVPGVVVTELAQVPGWFARPDVTGPVPAVLLVHPSGAWDRRARVSAEEAGTSQDVYLFDDLAVALLRAGVGVVGFDARFVTARRGEEGWAAGQVTFPALVQDAVSLLEYLREHPGVDGERISLLGLSLGTQVAVGAAAQVGGPCRLILAAPGAVGLDQHLSWMLVGRRLEWLLAAGLVDRDGMVDLGRVAALGDERAGWWGDFDAADFAEGVAGGADDARDFDDSGSTDVTNDASNPTNTPGTSPGRISYEQFAGVLLHLHDEFARQIYTTGDDDAPAEYWRTRREWPAMTEVLRGLRGKVWVHVGDEDWTTAPRQSWLLARSAPAGLDVKVTVHPNLGHLFSPRDPAGRLTFGPIHPSVVAALTAAALER